MIAKMVAIHWQRRPPCPYVGKPFKNLLQNRGCLGAESVHKSSGTTKVAKKIVVRWHLTYLLQGQVCFPMHLYVLHNICMVKLFRISDNFSSEATEPNLLKFLAHLSTKCSWWAIVVSQCHTLSVVRRAASTIVLKAYSSYAPRPIEWKLGRKHRGDL